MIKAIVIPARYGSQRFPGKPLVPVAGVSMIQRVWHSAQQVRGIDHCVVATDDDRIADHVRAFGGRVVMTDPACENGTARVQAALMVLDQEGIRVDAALNVQGDAVLTPPWVMQALVDHLGMYPVVTPAVQLSPAQLVALQNSKITKPSSGTLVTFDQRHRALYFSKTIIPYLRTVPDSGIMPVYRHIGLYGYTRGALSSWLQTPPTPLEQVEQLEQLRLLETGVPIQVVVVDYRGRTHASIDHPLDVAEVEAIIEREGDLMDPH
ncbi:MAG: 3-deoxy-manno-octulosonate cytidylyltransferase [Alphaproteobacteria bacterium]